MQVFTLTEEPMYDEAIHTYGVFSSVEAAQRFYENEVIPSELARPTKLGVLRPVPVVWGTDADGVVSTTLLNKSCSECREPSTYGFVCIQSYEVRD